MVPSPGLGQYLGSPQPGLRPGRGLLSPTGSRQPGSRLQPPWEGDCSSYSSSSRAPFGVRCTGNSSKQRNSLGMEAIVEGERPMSRVSAVSDVGEGGGRLPWRNASSPRGSLVDCDLRLPQQGAQTGGSGSDLCARSSRAPSEQGFEAGSGSCAASSCGDGGDKEQDHDQQPQEGEQVGGNECGGSSIVDAALMLLSPGVPTSSGGFPSRRSSLSSIGQVQQRRQPVMFERSIGGEEVVSPAPMLLSPRLGAQQRSSSSLGGIAVTSPRLGSQGLMAQQGPGGINSSSSSFASLSGCGGPAGVGGYGAYASAGHSWGQRGGVAKRGAPNPFQKLSEAVKNAGKIV